VNLIALEGAFGPVELNGFRAFEDQNAVRETADYLLNELSILTGRGVDVVFQHYEHPSYRQLFPPFQAHASVLDLLFNEGENSLPTVRSGRRTPFVPAEVATRLSEKVGS